MDNVLFSIGQRNRYSVDQRLRSKSKNVEYGYISRVTEYSNLIPWIFVHSSIISQSPTRVSDYQIRFSKTYHSNRYHHKLHKVVVL